jgi:two-component system sensor histidine kinase SenX3
MRGERAVLPCSGMTRVASRPGLALAAAVPATLVLLAVLATLQYRWAGEISEAERGRLRAGARDRAFAMSRDFDLEITRAFTELSVPPDPATGAPAAGYPERYDAWRRAASHPELVSGVFAVRLDDAGFPLFRYGEVERAFVPVSWPATLAPVRRKLEDLRRGVPFGPERGGRRRLPGPIVDESFALVSFPFGPGPGPGAGHGSPPPALGRFERGSPRNFRGFVPQLVAVIALDREAIVGHILPALAQRHFAGRSGLDYDLEIVRQEPPQEVLWRSRTEARRRADPDAVMGLFDLRFEAIEGGGMRGGRAREHGEDTGAWRLQVSHRAGPLDEVVAAARRRNLFVSFGVLILLGASMGLVVASSQRARRLADRQMEFVAAVSHELRTPVSVIRATAENLADGIAREPAQVREYGAIIRDDAVRLGDMLEGVLAFAGTIARRSSLPQDEVDVAQLIEDSLGAFESTLRERGIVVEKDMAPALPPVRGDALSLRRALDNIVENAVKYGGGGQWLAVRADAEDGRTVRVTIEDRGTGIAAPDLRRVFEPFFRGRDARGRGFGLGLSLVNRVVADHGGRLTVRSEPGRGATFTIELPAAPARAEASAESADALPHPRH